MIAHILSQGECSVHPGPHQLLGIFRRGTYQNLNAILREEPLWITLQPGESVTYTRNQKVPDGTPICTYHLDAHVKVNPDVEMDDDRFTIEVVAE